MEKMLLVLLLLYNFSISAQEFKIQKPDYKKIKKELKKKNSVFKNETLMKRYLKGDTAMTLTEKRYLYYGYTFNKHYSPYSRSDYQDSVRAISQKKELTFKDYELLDRYTDSILKAQPFNIKAMSAQLFATEKLFKRNKFDTTYFKANMVIDAILSSGNGLTKKTSFYVIDTSHEYSIIEVLGYSYGGSQSLIEHYDYLTLSENENNIEGLYFDVTPCLNTLKNMFKK